ncbi:MAG TPA: SDR family oxidoreductase [Humisphaera sp.]|jgi:NAD(P)-dependent dehydrogenase (short-subunit alcohol dehydrogenase family)|nr:SDR family oxidoreductase [Humisphaera sp.]
MLPGIKLFDLSGRTAIVTGGSKGLGLAMAEGFASAGASVMLVSRHLEEAQSAAATVAREYGKKAVGFQADISQPDQVNAMVESAMSQFGKIDILVNSAGINIRGAIDVITLEQFQQVMSINVTGTWLCSRAATVHMKKAGRGRIINLSSTLGLVGLSNRTPYCSSKGAVTQMTRCLALELAQSGITVNAICPGPFMTEINAPIAGTEEGKKFIVGATALGRWARMEEIQGAAIFLASDAASYVTGSMLSVDGGWTAQ